MCKDKRLNKLFLQKGNIKCSARNGIQYPRLGGHQHMGYIQIQSQDER